MFCGFYLNFIFHFFLFPLPRALIAVLVSQSDLLDVPVFVNTEVSSNHQVIQLHRICFLGRRVCDIFVEFTPERSVDLTCQTHAILNSVHVWSSPQPRLPCVSIVHTRQDLTSNLKYT